VQWGLCCDTFPTGTHELVAVLWVALLQLCPLHECPIIGGGGPHGGVPVPLPHPLDLDFKHVDQWRSEMFQVPHAWVRGAGSRPWRTLSRWIASACICALMDAIAACMTGEGFSLWRKIPSLLLMSGVLFMSLL